MSPTPETSTPVYRDSELSSLYRSVGFRYILVARVADAHRSETRYSGADLRWCCAGQANLSRAVCASEHIKNKLSQPEMS